MGLGATPHLPHEDLSSADEHGGTAHVEALLQPLQVQLLHLLVAALHLHGVEGEHGQSLHVLGWEDGREQQTRINTIKEKREKKKP